MSQLNNYWNDRLKKFDEIYNTETTSVLNDIEKYYRTAYNDLNKELAALQTKYADAKTVTMKEELVKDTMDNIDKQLTLLYENEERIINKSLKNTYVSSYMAVDESLKGLGISTKHMIPNAVEDAIRYNWSGATFSDRIWHNKDNLIFNLKETINTGLIKGSTYHEMAEELSNKLNVSYDACRTLINTEVQAIQVRSTLNNYEQNGIDKYEVTSILDKKTCKGCKKHDGEIIDISDGVMGDNLPPYHPNCRCTILPVIE